jgi:exonuclease III
VQACLGSLKLCYWNIHGWSSKIIGNKLCDKEFLGKILNYDIVALAELHSEKKLSLPGFMNIDQKIRDKTHKGPKIAGGIAIFIKNEYESLIKVYPNKNPNSIWIKIEKEKCGETEDIFIGSFYISPGKKKNVEKDFYASFNEEIEFFKQKGIVLIQGDLNARVGQELDYIDFDKHLDIGDIDDTESSQEPEVISMTGEIEMDYPPRNSEDKKVNPRGRDLLDICKVHDLLIANGRVTGDIFGKYTSHQYNGSALNDYLLVPNKFYQRISNFTVGDYAPWLSDHCPIYSNISLNSSIDLKTQTDKHNDIDPSFIFDANAKSKFSKGLQSTQMKAKINDLLENNDLSAKSLGNSIKLILGENAKSCKIKTRKIRKDNPHGAPWFDGECENSKNKVRKFGNDLKNVLKIPKFANRYKKLKKS